jgi:N-acyl-D-aspartate/D-glutamate deacylase
LEDLVRVGGENTARVFGLYPRKGVLAPGADADIVIVDPDLEATVDDAFYHCLCEVSVYRGQTFRGLALTTIVRGRVMMEDRQTVGPPAGHGIGRAARPEGDSHARAVRHQLHAHGIAAGGRPVGPARRGPGV